MIRGNPKKNKLIRNNLQKSVSMRDIIRIHSQNIRGRTKKNRVNHEYRTPPAGAGHGIPSSKAVPAWFQYQYFECRQYQDHDIEIADTNIRY